MSLKPREMRGQLKGSQGRRSSPRWKWYQWFRLLEIHRELNVPAISPYSALTFYLKCHVSPRFWNFYLAKFSLGEGGPKSCRPQRSKKGVMGLMHLMLMEPSSECGPRDLNIILLNVINTNASPVLLLPHAIIMFSQGLVTVLVGLVGLIDISVAQSCAIEWWVSAIDILSSAVDAE